MTKLKKILIQSTKPEAVNEEITEKITNPVSQPVGQSENKKEEKEPLYLQKAVDKNSLPADISLTKIFDVFEMEEFIERAAIMEYDGGLGREQAEHEAQNIILGARSESGLIGSMISELGAVELKGYTEEEINKMFNISKRSNVCEKVEWY
jgi:hypothetical protein